MLRGVEGMAICHNPNQARLREVWRAQPSAKPPTQPR